MDNYILNKNTGRVMKIGSKKHRSAIVSKIRQNTKNSICFTNVSYDDSKKFKNSLPELDNNKFYCYDNTNNNIITKNKSLKCEEILKYICNQLPNIIDKIIDDIPDDADRETTKNMIIEIFHDSLLN